MTHLKPFLIFCFKWILLSLFLVPTLNAQTAGSDSLNQRLSNTTDATAQINLILDFLEQNPTLDTATFYPLTVQVNHLADSLGLAQLSAQANYHYLNRKFSQNQGNDELPLIATRLDGLANFFGEKEETYWQLRTLALRANVVRKNGQSAESQALIDIILDKSVPFQQSPRFAGIIGDTYRVQGSLFYSRDYLKAKQAYGTAQEYYQRGGSSLRHKHFLALLNIAMLNARWKRWEEMNQAYQRLINSYQATTDSALRREAYIEYGISIAKQFEKQSPLDKDTKLLLNSNEQFEQALLYPNGPYARLYYQLGANQQNLALYGIEQLLLTEDTRDSLLQLAGHYYSECLKATVDENNATYMERVFNTAIQLHNLAPDNGNDNLKRLLRQINEGYLSTYGKLKMQTDSIAKISEENVQLEKAISKNKIQYNRLIFAILIIIIISIALLIYQRQYEQNMRKRLYVKMEALRSQMNSHFISNTLNAIDTLIMQGKREEASQHIISFSRLTREVLNFSKKSLIPLQDEINVLKRYLSFEKLRLRERLRIVWEIDETIAPEAHLVPSLLLQPFAENAIWHGILNKDQQTPGTLKIGIYDIDANTYYCTIEDNGIGRAAARKLQAQSEAAWESWSMNITEERIAHLKKINTIDIKTEDLYNEEGQSSGTRISIKLPKTLKSL